MLLDIKQFSFGKQCLLGSFPLFNIQFYFCTGYQPSLPTNDGGNFQLLSDGSELNDNGVLVNHQTSPNPAQPVLDIIRNPMLQRDEGIIIEKNQIFHLHQLTRILPVVKVTQNWRNWSLLKQSKSEHNLEKWSMIFWIKIGTFIRTKSEHDLAKSEHDFAQSQKNKTYF